MGFLKVVEKIYYEFVKYGDDYVFFLDVDIKKDSGIIYYNDWFFFLFDYYKCIYFCNLFSWFFVVLVGWYFNNIN